MIEQGKDDPGDLVEFSVHGKLLAVCRWLLSLVYKKVIEFIRC